jgi:tRNA A-37 threonylcarbamoyl transferase component Bud32
VADAQRWVERREPARYWRVDAAFAEPLAAIGWPEWSAVERALRDSAAAGRTATAILALPGRAERIHLRPVRHGGLLGSLWGAAIWGTARPAAELRATERLRAAGAPVPRPLLVVAQRVRGPLWSAVVGTQHVEDARDGVAWLAARPDRPALLRGARAAGAAIRRFHDAGGSHADLHVKNLLFRERGADTEVLVIDLDRARADAPPDPARRCAELMRLVRALHKRGLADQVGARGCAAAFSAYYAGDRALRRALLAHLPRERRRLARHAWLYRGAGAD